MFGLSFSDGMSTPEGVLAIVKRLGESLREKPRGPAFLQPFAILVSAPQAFLVDFAFKLPPTLADMVATVREAAKQRKCSGVVFVTPIYRGDATAELSLDNAVLGFWAEHTTMPMRAWQVRIMPREESGGIALGELEEWDEGVATLRGIGGDLLPERDASTWN